MTMQSVEELISPKRWVLVAVALMIGCSESESPASDGATSEFSKAGAWHLADAPVYSLTASTGEPSVVLFEVSSGFLFEDGGAVVKTGTLQLVYFDSTGNTVGVGGRRGSGPGEFNGPTLSIVGTSAGIGVWDRGSNRFTHFRQNGAYVFDTALPSVRGGSRVFGYLPGAGVVTAPLSVPVGQQRVYTIWSDTGGGSGTLGGGVEPPSAMMSWAEERGGTVNSALPARCVGGLGETITDSAVFVMDAPRGVVTSYSVRGGSHTVYEARQRRQVTEEVHAELLPTIMKGAVLSRVPVDTIKAALGRTLPFGTAMPAWTGLIGDPSGRLWLRLYRCATGLQGEDMYGIIDLQGTVLGRISIPIASRILAVRGERVLVARLDDMDVEHLELYLIRRGGD